MLQSLYSFFLKLHARLPFPLLRWYEVAGDVAVLCQDALQLILVFLLCSLILLVHLAVVLVVHQLLNASLELLLLLALVLQLLHLPLLPHLLLMDLVLLTTRPEADLPAEGLDFREDARAIVGHGRPGLRLTSSGREVHLIRDEILLEKGRPPR